jgi:hypothetical protein
MEEDVKGEIKPQEVKCIQDCINRGTPICNGCVNGSKYEWDYTDIYG